MEAYVDVDGCILCFEGIGDIQPGVSDNLTEGNETGVLLANVELEKAFEGKSLRLNNLYYDLNSAEILPPAAQELDKLIVILKDNPHLKIELGSHTDSRGTDASNLDLSERRAESAVRYIRTFGSISDDLISWKGYGEQALVNKCGNGVVCSEAEHAENRRTEITILGVDDEVEIFSLAKRIEQDKEEALILELMNQQQIRIDSNYTPETIDEMQSGISAEQAKQMNSAEEDLMSSYFSVILRYANAPLDKKAEIFKVYGCTEYKTGSGMYVYHKGQFSDEQSAKQFMQESIKQDFPHAFVAKFIDGKMHVNY